MVLVTVLITSFNPGRYLKKSVTSVFEQTFKNWKLIIVDDASTDHSLDSIKPYLANPRVKLIQNAKNLGQAKSLNVGLKHVTTPYVIQLDSDDWLVPNTIKCLVTEAKKQPKNVALISGNIKVVCYNKHGRLIKKYIRKGKSFNNRYKFMLANKSAWPRFYRTSALKKVKGWPTDGPYEGRYIEDLRILFRLIERFRFHWINKTLYIHRKHSKNQTKQQIPMIITLKWLIRSTLRRWGNKYSPVFRKTPRGYIRLFKLEPSSTFKLPKRKSR